MHTNIPSAQDFDRYCPAARDPDNMVYQKCSVALEQAGRRIQAEVLGPIDIEALPQRATIEPQVLRLQCLMGFRQALPQLDLVVTPTGVGVVSNDNLAPASRDRVDALRRQLDRDIYDAVDILIEYLRRQDGWGATEQALSLMPNFLYSGVLMRRYAGQPEATRHEAIEARPKIAATEQELRGVVGDALVDHLLAVQRTAAASSPETAAITTVRTYIGLCLSGDLRGAQSAIARLVAFLEAMPQEFPAYIHSSAYTANHTPTYEQQQKKSDSAFFFS